MRRRPSIAETRARRAAVDDDAVVFEAALRFLEARSRSISEVRQRLTRAGYQPPLVGRAIDRLVALGMLDDEAFARHWVESRDRAHPRGEIALRRELREKGIRDDVVRSVLTERASLEARDAGDVDDGSAAAGADDEAARRLLERRATALARVSDPRIRRQRAYALLARNGFDPETCARLSQTVVDEGERR